jgi:anthranilate synthase component 1
VGLTGNFFLDISTGRGIIRNMYPDLKEYLKLASEYTVIPVYEEIIADTETPVSVLSRFIADQNVFLLESMEGGEKWGRYSFIGVRPELFLEVDHSGGKTGKLEKLREIYKGVEVAPVKGLPRFSGGAVGFIGYEGIAEFERMPAPKPVLSGGKPVSRFVRADRMIVFDNIRHTVKIVISSKPASMKSPAEAYRAATAEIEKIKATLASVPCPTPPLPDHHVEFKSNMPREKYTGMVEQAKKYIRGGDIIQVVLSQRFTARTSVAPLQMYRALRLLNPSPYTFFLKIGGQALVGSSPEVMVRLTGNVVELRPIAGTRPRGHTEQEDRSLADELLSDEKEKAEHVMLVDLGRNDVGRVSESGSVQVREFMVIERYSHVMHLVSHIQGILRREFDAYDVVKATFPAGTLSGAPKIRAMEIIHELEPEPRGAYGGAVGYIGYDGNMDLAITIRTLETEGSTVAVQAGAGIVFDSQPEREFEETCHKARAMQNAVLMAAQNLRITPDGAYVPNE